MRCSCTNCGVYMIQSEGSHLGCVCSECGNRCTACLGTDSIMDREQINSLKDDQILSALLLERIMSEEDEDD